MFINRIGDYNEVDVIDIAHNYGEKLAEIKK